MSKNIKVIGFDLDHTLIKYKRDSISKLITNILVKNLIEIKKYPINIIPKDSNELNLMSNFNNKLFFDIKNNIFLKLSHDYEILRAYSGFDRIFFKELLKIYNSNLIMNKNELYNINLFMSFNDMFHQNFIGIISKIIQLKKENNFNILDRKSSYDIIQDIFEIWEKNVIHYNNTEVFNISRFEDYYPTILQRRSKYLHKIDKTFLKILKELKDNGYFIFIITNSHYEPLNSFLEYSIGKNYNNYFDLISIMSKKPTFWDNNYSYNFYNYNIDKKHNTINNFTTFSDKIIKIFGNFNDLDLFFKQKFGDNYYGIYYGDSLKNDLSIIKSRKNFTVNFIYDELGEIITGDHSSYLKHWGSSLYDINIAGEIKETYYYNRIKKYSNLIFKDINCINNLNYLSNFV